MLGEPLGDGAADAARRAGDDCDAPGQVEKAGQGFLPMRRSVQLDIFHESISVFPSQSKPRQATQINPSKIAWICGIMAQTPQVVEQRQLHIIFVLVRQNDRRSATRAPSYPETHCADDRASLGARDVRFSIKPLPSFISRHWPAKLNHSLSARSQKRARHTIRSQQSLNATFAFKGRVFYVIRHHYTRDENTEISCRA